MRRFARCAAAGLALVLAASIARGQSPTFSVGTATAAQGRKATGYLDVPTGAGGLSQLAAGPDGALWFTESTASRLGRVDLAGSVVEWPVPSAGSSPYGVAAGSDGGVWFAEFTGGRIGRFQALAQGPPRAVPFRGAAGDSRVR